MWELVDNVVQANRALNDTIMASYFHRFHVLALRKYILGGCDG